MTKIKLEYLIWNEWNLRHLSKHSLSKEEVEKAISNIRAHKYGYGGRIILLGEVSGRILAIIVAGKQAGKYYVVTARVADRKERRIVYEKNN